MIHFLINLSRPNKRRFWLLVDTILVPVSLYLAFALRLDAPNVANWIEGRGSIWLFPIVTVIGLGLCYALRLHRLRLHSFDTDSIKRVGIMALSLVIATFAARYFLDLWAPRSVPLIFGAIFFIAAVSTRMIALGVAQFMQGVKKNAIPVAIYGAGLAGIQLASALRQSSEFWPVLFVDDNRSLRGLVVSGLKVKTPEALKGAVENDEVKQVLLAMPSISRARQEEIIADLSELDCEVKVLPSYVDLISGNGIAADLKPISPDELLTRDNVDLDVPDIEKAYTGRVVLVTGAGGSIGSELCRQLIITRPAHIVLFERSELALYQIDRELRPIAEKAGIGITTRLGSVTDIDRMREVLVGTGAEIILHAAAYKHVPLVEENEIEGARNNVIGTLVAAEAASEAGVERFILISTDKAVRPTNIMGATKRLAELIVQDIQTRSNSTVFSMVRFGNVLGSSGSMLPLFEEQIRQGGPVTVTHPEVTRFFMTIPEASRLVLLAGAYAEGGDVFVLDMGEPVKIMDMARRMIEMAGQTVLEDGEGDIEIKVVGLRPGEKLYEELLIDQKNLVTTPHEKIMRAAEDMLGAEEIAEVVTQLRETIANNDRAELRSLIRKHVKGYHVEA